MSIRSKIWTIVTNAYPAFLRKVYKMDLGIGVRIAHKAHLDKSVNPKGVHIGDHMDIKWCIHHGTRPLS